MMADDPFPEWEFHPLANIFPMLDDEALADLAADIKANGQTLPVLLDADNRIVDGRNRYKACRLIGIEPWWAPAPDGDVLSLVISLNVKRRQLTKGQAAIAAGEAWVIAERNGLTLANGEKLAHFGQAHPGVEPISKARDYFAKQFGVAKDYVAMARDLVRDDQSAAKAVKDGDANLRTAHHEWQLRVGKVNNEAQRRARLRADRPDLADLVASEQISLEDAEREAAKDIEELKSQRWAVTVNLINAIAALDHEPSQAAETREFFDPLVEQQKGMTRITVDRLRRAADYLTALAELWED